MRFKRRKKTAPAGWWFRLEPAPLPLAVRLERAEMANRHATELVDRLLAERRTLLEAVRALRELRAQDAKTARWLWGQQIAIRHRLATFCGDDGSKPRDALADIEEILGA